MPRRADCRRFIAYIAVRMSGPRTALGVHLRNVLVNVLSANYLMPNRLRARLLRACGNSLGAGTTVKSRCTIAGDVPIRVGSDCFISYRCVFDARAPIVIGDRVNVANGVTILTSTHEIGERIKRASTPLRQPVSIGEGCWLGSGVTVLPGVSVGEGCVVAAGAVVAGDCAADGLYAGVPARRVRDL